VSKHASGLEEARHWSVRYRKGRLIYDEGDPATGIFRVDKGCVRLQVTSLVGDRQIVAFLFPGDLFGLCVDQRTSSAEAATDVGLTCYSLVSVVELSTRSSEVMFELLRRANNLYGDLAHHVEHITHLPAAERVVCFLSWLAQREHRPEGAVVTLPMSRRDMSDFLGLTPETLSRVIKALQADGVVSVSGPRTFTLRRQRRHLPAEAVARPDSTEPQDGPRRLRVIGRRSQPDRGASETAVELETPRQRRSG
jgi:CRP-like cAMP-binding protein